jgi:hypothetical protein
MLSNSSRQQLAFPVQVSSSDRGWREMAEQDREQAGCANWFLHLRGYQ